MILFQIGSKIDINQFQEYKVQAVNSTTEVHSR